tara:strand:- start:1253 stop:1402 length:150 start_codon:yes stop_codon:yes gene_type:complete
MSWETKEDITKITIDGENFYNAPDFDGTITEEQAREMGISHSTLPHKLK